MKYVIEGRKPENIFRFFEDICAIPHGSGNEKAVADYIVAFAEARGLEYKRDAVHNVFIKKPATAGRENEPPMMMQAHTDMVCEKNADTVHDFLKDPLDLYVEDGWLHARGTTLGADDGIGVAIMLAALDGAAASHPALECLFTVSEETGIISAMHDGKYKRYLDPETLTRVLRDAYSSGGGQTDGDMWRTEQNEEQI